MTNIISRQQWRLKENWVSEDDAKWIAYRSQLGKWNTEWNKFSLNDQGKWYSELWPLEREMLRRSQRSWKPVSAYTVVKWKVVLKK